MKVTGKINEFKKKINKKGIILFLIIFIVGITGFIGYENSTVNKWGNLIYPGVAVEGTDLSGKTKEQAEAILKQNHGNAIISKKINIKVQDKTYSLEYSKIKAAYDIDSTVNEVFSYGKNLSLMGKYNLIKTAKTKDFELKFVYDKKTVSDFIASIGKEVNKNAVNASITVSGNISVTPDTKGAKLQKEALEKELFSKINGKIGTDTNVTAVVEAVNPKITSDMLSSVNAQISTFSTNYAYSSASRANNIALATRTVNGKILLPGETFSFNDTVGIRTVAKGYQQAPVDVDNKVVLGLGGGICQVSTTLYNAVLRGDLKIAERNHHSLPSRYVPLGMDATVDYGNLDFKFTNSYSYPLYIQGNASGGSLTFSIYSNSSLTSTTCTVNNDVVATIQPTTKYVDDATLLAGKTVLDQPAYVGHKVNVYRKIYKNGVFVSQETVSNDYYKVIDGVIRRGTKKAEVITPTAPAKQTTPAQQTAPAKQTTPSQQTTPTQ